MAVETLAQHGIQQSDLHTEQTQRREKGKWGSGEVGNPVVSSAEAALLATNLVYLNEGGINQAAELISNELLYTHYHPSLWRSEPLHLSPADPYSPTHPSTRATLDWIFLVSSLNFSFWSDLPTDKRYTVTWRPGWGQSGKKRWTGYWSLLAAINRALEEGLPITDPVFYSSEALCPDSLIKHIFRPADSCEETIPLLPERISILRDNGRILVDRFNGSFHFLLAQFLSSTSSEGALGLVKLIVGSFPSFRDQSFIRGRPVYFWKRAQILVAETWAAFHPPPPSHPSSPSSPHLFFPDGGVDQLTMFPDYRVPQILHHLRALSYPPALLTKLQRHEDLPSGCAEEVSIRAGAILAVEVIRDRIISLRRKTGGHPEVGEVNSVMIDFFLWGLAKVVDSGERVLQGIDIVPLVPVHRTRSIWY